MAPGLNTRGFFLRPLRTAFIAFAGSLRRLGAS
jgi:hypothetical protein